MRTRLAYCFCLAVLVFTCVFSVTEPATAFDVTQDTKLLWLVNRTHPVDKAYIADDLVDMNVPRTKAVKMREAAAADYARMVYNMRVEHGIADMLANSGYRSYDFQTTLFNYRVNSRMRSGQSYSTAFYNTALYTAVPGTSEHQIGLAMDVTIDGKLNGNFADTEAGKWMKANAWQFGFILRYTDEKYDYTMIADEPWHFRYVGKPHAQIIFENDWCYEEYVKYLQTKGSYTYVTEDNFVYDIIYTKDTSLEFENVLSISSDNCGGYIITTGYEGTQLCKWPGNWAENDFVTLLGNSELPYPGVILPADAISRADFATMCTLLSLPEKNDQSIEFADVATDAYYAEAVDIAVKSGVMEGTDKGFQPSASLTREQVAVALARLLPDIEADDNSENSAADFVDSSQIGSWALPGVEKMVDYGLMNGRDGGRFAPKAELSWAEAAALLNRVKSLLAEL